MEILLATKNKNKFKELKNIFDKSNSQHELLFYPDLIEVEEDKEQKNIHPGRYRRRCRHFSCTFDESGARTSPVD